MKGPRRFGIASAALILLLALPGAAAIADYANGPELGAIPDQTIAELDQLRVSVTATDPDLPNDVLRFSLAQGPPGAAMSASGTITWTPGEADGPGTYTFVAEVEDATGQSDRKSFQVTVAEVNTPPRIGSIPDQSLGPGDELQLDVPVTDGDEPANPLTFTATDLPPGTSIDPSTGRISGTVTSVGEAAAGTAVITVSDGADPPAHASRTFSWQVTAGNRAPTMEPIGGQTVGRDGVVRFAVAAADADSKDELSFWLAEGVDRVPAGAAIDDVSGEFTWTPTAGQYGATYRFNIVVSDSGSPRLSNTQLITITLPDYNSPPEVVEIPDQHSAEGDVVSLAVAASDLEGDNLEFSATGLPTGLAIDPVTGMINGKVAYDAGPGSFAVVVTASDDGLPVASTTVRFLWEIDDTNRRPEVTPVTVVALVGRITSAHLEVSDPDGDPLTYTILSDPANGTLSGTPPELNYLSNGGRSDAFIFRVSDGEFDVEATVLIEIRESNAPPDVGLDEYEVLSGETLQVDAPGLLGNDHDPDNEPLTAMLVARPDHGDLVLNADGSFVYAADEGYVGADKFTYAAADAFGEQSTATVALSVTATATPGGDDEPTANSRTAIVAATTAAWTQPAIEDPALIPRLRRALAGAITSGIGSIPRVAYPLLLLVAALALALTFGKISLLPAGNGRTHGEGTIAWYDTVRGFGVLMSDDGEEEIFMHGGSLEKGEEVAAGRRVEFIAAEIRGRRVALKVWAAI